MIFLSCEGGLYFASSVNGDVVRSLHSLEVSCKPVPHLPNTHSPDSPLPTQEIESPELDILDFCEGDGFALSGGEVVALDFELFFVDENVLVLVDDFLFGHGMTYYYIKV